MKADRANILKEFICHNGPQYVIPVYQRNYTWDTKNVGKLLSDVKRILDKDNKITHFIGNIIYVITDKLNIAEERAVVDGQQRLTTVFLFLYALRDLAFKINDEDAAFDIGSIYLNNNVRQEQYKNKLKPLINDDSVLQSIINHDFDSLHSSNSLVYQNYLYIKEEFYRWLLSGATIAQIIDAINQLIVVWVQLEQDDNAQQIFESINSTGESLTAPDLIRNYILMNKKDSIQTRLYKDYWLKIEKNVVHKSIATNRKKSAKKIEEFFRFYLATKEFVLTKISAVYASFKNYWLENIEEGIAEEDMLKDILCYSKYYNFLYVKDNILSPYVNSLAVMRRIESNMPTPLLLGVVDLKEKGAISDEQVISIIDLVNTFLIRRHMCGEDTSSITRLFPQVLNDVLIKCHEIGYEQIVDITKFYLSNSNKQKSSFMPTDEQIAKYLSDANSYILSHTKTFFDIIEGDNPISIDLASLTVEHVLPQKSTDYWLNYVGDDKTKYNYYANLIGNLTLADRATNSEISNRDFNVKKAALLKVGRINLTNSITDCEMWDYSRIIQRTKELIDVFNNRFPFFESKNDYEKIDSYRIDFEIGDTIASALLFSNGKVELLPNSLLRKCSNRSKMLTKKLDSFINSGDIEDNIINYLVKESLHFSSISAVTDFVYGGSNNGWICWKDDAGEVINVSLRRKIESN